MNKKLAIGISIILGGVMMATTALASGSSSNGYEAYKLAFKNTRAASSITGTAAITVTDNGNVILQSNNTIKMNRDSRDLSGNIDISAGDKIKKVTVYRQNGQTIIKPDGDEFYNVESSKRDNFHRSEKHKSPELTKDVENIVDLLVGNYRDYISLESKTDGNKQVSLELSGSQVSPIANAVASLVVRERSEGSEKGRHSDIHDQLPKLVDEVRLANIDMKADIDNQEFIKKQTANITITGKDTQGNYHEIMVSVELNLSDFNNTTPDTVDLTGKQVKTIQHKDMERFGHHG